VLYLFAVIADRPTDELDPQEQSVIKRSPARGGRSVKVSFILPRDGGGVSVVGDFNDWDPTPTRCGRAATAPGASR
jgi:hypothetical protein